MGFMERLLGKNWLTTLGGIVAVIGGVLPLLPASLGVDPQWSITIIALGAGFAGITAKAANVHSTLNETMTATKEAAVIKASEQIEESKKA